MARGPQASITCPVGAVPITAGASIQAAINANPTGTAFCLGVGVHSILAPILPKTGNTFCGTYGAIIDGTGWVSSNADDAAFQAHNVAVANVTLQNLLIRNMPQRGVHCFGAQAIGWLIEYCEITLCRTGINIGSGTDLTGGSAIIRNNVIHHNTIGTGTKGGYLMFRGINTLWEDNEISYNGTEQKIVATTGVTFRGNYVHHNLGDGIWYDTSNFTVLIENNLVEDNVRFGIHHEIGGSATIRTNTVSRSADTGIMVVTCKDTDVSGNILVNNFRGIDLFLKCSVVGQGMPAMPGGYDLSNCTVHDNTITVPTTTGALGSMLNTEPSSCTPTFLVPYLNGSKGNVWQGNAYRVPNLTTKYFWWTNAVTKSFAEWQALGQDTTGTYALATNPSLLTADRLIYESSITLGTTPYPSGGDPKFGRGMAFRMDGTTLRLMIGSYNPAVILEFTVPASRTGAATFSRILGTLPNVSSRFGLHWDDTDQKLYSIQGLLYGNVATAKTFSRGSIVNGALVSDGEWALTGVSYKAVQGGMTAVPSWFRSTYGGGRLASGFGGYYSVVGTGPASMGPALASFTPPTANGETVIAKPLQQYPFTSSAWAVARQRRPTNYKQYFENTNTTTGAPLNNTSLVPVDPIAGPPANTGFWTWTDEIYGGGAWVDTPNFSGMVYLASMGSSCCWYGNNFGYPNECSSSIGSPAAINSTSRLHYWLITNPTDLGSVQQGLTAATVPQSTMTAVQFNSLPITVTGSASTYPFVGKPSERLTPAGMTWIPSIQRLAVALYQCTNVAPASSSWRIYFFKVSEGGDPPTPAPPANDNFASATALSGAVGSVAGSTVNATIQSGEPPAMASVWYTYPAGVNPVDFSVSATGQTIQVYTGTSVGGLTLVTSGTTVVIPAGVITYRIRVIPVVTTNGFTLAWDDEEPPTPPDPPPPTPDPLVVTNASLPIGEQTVAYSVTYSATGGVQPSTWTQTGAPSGVTMSTSGVLSGIPAANGTFTVAATVTDSQPVSTLKSLSLVIIPPPVVSTLALTSGQINVAYPGAQLAVAGGTSPYTWTKTGGPTGLDLSTTGAYTGTPTQSGSFTVAVIVTDARGAQATRNLPLTIAAAPDALVVTTASLPAGEISIVYAGATMAATGGVPPYTWTQTGGPTGLSMSAGGVYSGTPSQSGAFTVAVKVTDSTLVNTTRDLLLGIAAAPLPPTPEPIPPLVLTTTSLPQGTVGAPYSATLSATGGNAPLTFSAQTLPTGLLLSPSGLLSGTPTVAVDVVVQFSVTDSSSPSQTTGAGLALIIVGLPTDPNVDPPTTDPVPVAPVLYVPRNKSKNVKDVTTGGPVVRWFAVDGAVTYQIFHGTTPAPPLVGSVTAGDATYEADYPANSLFFPVTRTTRTTYYWYVVALNAGGQTPSAHWKYTTAGPTR